MNKRGVTPVIATVLLISIVIVLAAIIFIWARSFVAEKAEKFERAVELSCDSVNMEVGVFDTDNGYQLDITNRGEIPVYGVSIRRDTPGNLEVLEDFIFEGTVSSGQSQHIPIPNNLDVTPDETLVIVPIILGEDSSGRVPYTCSDRDDFTASVF